MATSKKRPAGRLGKGLSSLMSTPVAVSAPAPAQAPAQATASAAAPAPAPASPPAAVAAPAAPAPAPRASTLASDASAGAEGDVPRETSGLRVEQVPLAELHPNPLQPRRTFDNAALEGLATSIRAEGVIQPVTVRPRPAGGFEIIAGERRWRAAGMAGLSAVPVLVHPLSDADTARWALIENLQREDLNPIERAAALQHLCESQGLRHEEVGDAVGLSRSSVSNLLRLLGLAPEVRSLVSEGHLRMGHARALVAVEDPSAQASLAQRCVREGWSVRALEQAVRKLGQGGLAEPKARDTPAPAVRAAWLRDLEAQLTAGLEAPVRVSPGRKKGTGTVTLEYRSLEDFDRLVQRLGVQTG